MPVLAKFAVVLAILAANSCVGSQAQPVAQSTVPPLPPLFGYEVVKSYPHDPQAFTQGLFFLDGYMYESTGLEGRSSIRKVRYETGEVLQKQEVPNRYFGEGIVNWRDKILELTWVSKVGFIYDLASFRRIGEFAYPGEGWGLTQDGQRIIMSDGTPELRFLDPETLRETGRVTVTLDGRPLANLNEIEWIKGEVYANVWQTNWIVRIDPASGKVVGRIDLTGLLSPSERGGDEDVLNGIAYDAATDRLFVTGKLWPKLYEIKLVPR